MPSPSPLEQIARACGVSKNTASAVLRNRPGYAPETVEKVRKAADAIGYQVNPMVSALMRGLRRSRPGAMQGNLVYLFSGADDFSCARGYDIALFAAAQQRARELGFELDTLPVPRGSVGIHRLKDVLYARGVEGVIVGPLAQGRKHLTLDWSRLSAVALGFSLIRPDLHRIATNQYHVMATAFRELRRLGYRRIGVCLNPSCGMRFDFAWHAGLMTVQSTLASQEIVPPLVVDEITRKELARWHRNESPDVIIAAGHKLERHLEAIGICVPQDIGLVDLTGEPGPDRIATMARDWTALGEGAVDLLAGMILRNEKGLPAKPSRLLIPSAWSPGNSLRSG